MPLAQAGHLMQRACPLQRAYPQRAEADSYIRGVWIERRTRARAAQQGFTVRPPAFPRSASVLLFQQRLHPPGRINLPAARPVEGDTLTKRTIVVRSYLSLFVNIPA